MDGKSTWTTSHIQKNETSICIFVNHSESPPSTWNYYISEVRSRMRALDLARTGIKIAQLNGSSRSPYILFSNF